MSTAHVLLVALGLSIAINTVMFLIAFRYKTDRLTDVSYAVTFIVLAGYSLAVHPVQAARLVAFGMVVIWALRLGTFLLIRIQHTGVDHRFDAMRDHFGQFGKFWELQALSVWVILLPSILGLMHKHMAFNALSIIGIFVWASGVVIEGFADAQKFAFSNNPAKKGLWIDEGLWHYSRHPNYLGEMMTWIGVYLVVVPSLTVAQAAIAIVGPAYIVALLLFVSGIPLLEKGADQRWGTVQAYREYRRRTSLLFLAPPKR